MLTSKQRAYLRGLANSMPVTLQIGKDGVNDGVIASVNEQLEAHEMIKGKVLDNALVSARTVAGEICAQTRAESVQCIGSKFVLYRPAAQKEKRKLVLPK